MKDLTAREVAAIRKPGKHRRQPSASTFRLPTTARRIVAFPVRSATASRIGTDLGRCDLVTSPRPGHGARDAASCCSRARPDRARAQGGCRRCCAAASTMTFRGVRRRRISRAHEAGWRNAKHRQQWPTRLRDYVYPTIGVLPVQAVDLALVMKILEPIWTEKPETACRVRGRIEAILDWARCAELPQRDEPEPAGRDISTSCCRERQGPQGSPSAGDAISGRPRLHGRAREQTSERQRARVHGARRGPHQRDDPAHVGGDRPRRQVWTIPAGASRRSATIACRCLIARSRSWTAAARGSNPITCSSGRRRARACQTWPCSSCCAAWTATAARYTASGRPSAIGAGETTAHPREVTEVGAGARAEGQDRGRYQRGDLLERSAGA